VGAEALRFFQAEAAKRQKAAVKAALEQQKSAT
jgi:hypothetical protein